MLFVAGDDLLPGTQIEPGEHGVDAVGGRSGEGDRGEITAERRRVAGAEVGRHPDQLLEVPTSAATARKLDLDPRGGRLGGGPRYRALGARVEIDEPIEHWKLCAKHVRVARCWGWL